jgi:hypothetical protein
MMTMGSAYHLIVQFLNDTNLGNNVVLKPQSRNTLHWLQVSLLCVIPTVPRVSGEALNFTDSLRQVLSSQSMSSPLLTDTLGKCSHAKC